MLQYLYIMTQKDRFDFLGVGDVVIDTFIELIDAWIEDDNPEKTKELCMKFGNKLPYKDEVTVSAAGNAPNAAHAAMKLGLKVGVVTNIGNDFNGSQIFAGLKQNGIDTSYVTVHKGHKSNHNYILRYREERTILVHHNEYDYKFPHIDPGPKWLYLSSLAKNSLKHHEEIAKYLKNHPETKLAFQPGTFQIQLGYKKLKDLYKLTEIFFCNVEEARKILQNRGGDIKNLLAELHGLGPKIVVITDGPNGAYLFDGKKYLHGKIYPDPAPPVSRTGAGDAFASTFTSAVALGKSLEEALLWGPINSMSVVQQIGAQAGHLSRSELLKLLEKAPKYYKIEKI